MLAATDGRFNEALTGLEAAGSVFATEGNVLEQVNPELKLATSTSGWATSNGRWRPWPRPTTRSRPKVKHGPPSESDVASLVAQQLAAAMAGTATTAGTDAMRLRGIVYEVVQAQIGTLPPQFELPAIRWRRASLRQLQADLLLLRERPADALAAAEDGLADQAAYPDLDLAWKLQWRRARALAALSRPDALDAFRDAMGAADRLRMAPLGYRLDATFLRDKLPMAQSAIDAALAAGDTGSVVWFVELTKSRARATALSTPRTTVALGAEDEQAFDDVSAKIDALAFAQYSGAADAAALTRRAELLGQRDRLLESIRIRDPRWRTMTESVPIDLTGIRAQLGPDRAALVLLHRPGQVISAVVDQDGVAAGSVTLSAKTVAGLTAYAENPHRPSPDEFLADLSQEADVALADLVAAEVLERATAKEIVVVRSGCAGWFGSTLAG